MSEWIRPDGCEGGACVEYRTVGDDVFIRSSRSPHQCAIASVAEWDTFVAGLVGDKICYEHADYPEIVAAYEQTGAENAHLTELLATVTAERDQLRKVASARADEISRQMYERNQLEAEAAVLRHRDRRTQAVVEAAVTYVEGIHDPYDDRDRALITAVDAYERGPTEAPASTLAAEQPQPVAQPTDGPEPQGQAQPGSGVVWHHPCGKTAITSPGVAAPMECEDCDLPGGWVTYSNSTGSLPPIRPGSYMKVHWGEPRVWNTGDPEPEGVEKVTDNEGDVWVRTGKVWIYIDENDTRVPSYWHPLTEGCAPLTEVLPEPTPVGRYLVGEKGPVMLSKPVDSEVFAGTPPPTCDCAWNDGHAPAHIVGHHADCPAWVPRPGALDSNPGRAGEAQTISFAVCPDTSWPCEPPCDACTAEARLYSADSSPDAPKNSSDVRPQDRTEVGLDAAIEAAVATGQHYESEPETDDDESYCICGDPWVERHAAEVFVRAASPLIERAALNAAADAIEGAVAAGKWQWRANERNAMHDAAKIVRDRATRTETS